MRHLQFIHGLCGGLNVVLSLGAYAEQEGGFGRGVERLLAGWIVRLFSELVIF